MKLFSSTDDVKLTRGIEILSEDEEYYVGVVRNILECVRGGTGTIPDLKQVECALVAAGASRLLGEGVPETHRMCIRGVQFTLSKCSSDVCKIELRFESLQ
jgi:hypothetical protein